MRYFIEGEAAEGDVGKAGQDADQIIREEGKEKGQDRGAILAFTQGEYK